LPVSFFASVDRAFSGSPKSRLGSFARLLSGNSAMAGVVPGDKAGNTPNVAGLMTRFVRLEELLVGAEGTALFRNVVDGDDDFIAARLVALRRLLDKIDAGDTLGADVPELDVDAGYAAWAAVYDSMPNALIRAEEPLVHQALAGVAPGAALDAACGTGRHAAALVAAGHQTIGVDRSPEMLGIAATKVPEADFRTGDLMALPLDDASVDVAVCSLALTHLTDPAPAIAELARVVRPGGRVILSDAHPTFVLLLGQGLFPHGQGFAFVRNHVHLHGTYLAAFAAAGLVVRDCAEAPMEDDLSLGLFAGAAEAAEALWAGIPVALVWTLERPA
jgi:SAM-dependent methyltransferase